MVVNKSLGRERRRTDRESPSRRSQVQHWDYTPLPNSASTCLQKSKSLALARMQLNGCIKICPQRTDCEHRMRHRWKRYLQLGWPRSQRRPSKNRRSACRPRASLAKLPIEVGSTRVNSASLSRVAFATESTSAQSPRSPVSFVGAAPRTLIYTSVHRGHCA